MAHIFNKAGLHHPQGPHHHQEHFQEVSGRISGKIYRKPVKIWTLRLASVQTSSSLVSTCFSLTILCFQSCSVYFSNLQLRTCPWPWDLVHALREAQLSGTLVHQLPSGGSSGVILLFASPSLAIVSAPSFVWIALSVQACCLHCCGCSNLVKNYISTTSLIKRK